MKIIHSKSGKAYHLAPGTQLEIERPNLFFNEYGEQTVPIDIPCTDLNRSLTGYADEGTNKSKPQENIECAIQDGEYYMPCRQAVLQASRKGNISTSFYMNEGSFLSQIKKISLKEIFGDETVPGISTVAEGISFCKSLLTTYNEHYACFPVLIDFDGRKYMNRVEWMNASGDYLLPSSPSSTPPSGYVMGLYNEFKRIEQTGDSSTMLDPGYYISPFIRARFLLRRIFAYFGYTLATNFFDTQQPFKDMVYVNNTMDALVNGTILLAHLVPDCYCSDILDVYRKKFNCEFVADEVTHTVTVQFFNDIIDNPATVDLSRNLVAPLSLDYSDGWKRIKLSSETTIDDADNSVALSDLLQNHPECWFEPKDGAYYHTGFSINKSIEKISGATIPYSSGGELEEIEITIPDCAISMSLEEEGRENEYTDIATGTTTTFRYRERSYFPLIGDGNALNSTVNSGVVANEGSKTTILTSSNHDQKPALCFVYFDSQGFYTGTTTNYSRTGAKLWNYTLHYNGEFGIFEQFYRKMDDMYRNSLLPVEAKLLLNSMQKMNINALSKIVINGLELLIDNLKYSLGGDNDPIESQFRTVKLYEPVSVATAEKDRLTESPYEWKLNLSYSISISVEEYNNLSLKSNSLPYVYPVPPTPEQYNAGGTYYQRMTYVPLYEVGRGLIGYMPTTTWLTPQLKQ
ncbi:MAG: hypothetical protein WCR36_03405 [Bacteroidaceae bacterium]